MKVIIIAGKVVFAVIWLGLFAILGGATGELSSQSIGLLSVLLAVLVITLLPRSHLGMMPLFCVVKPSRGIVCSISKSG